MNVALGAESLRIALGHVGLLAERRMGHLWDAAVTSLGVPGTGTQHPPFDGGAPPALAGLGLRYAAAARYTRLRQLAQPVTLDVPAPRPRGRGPRPEPRRGVGGHRRGQRHRRGTA